MGELFDVVIVGGGPAGCVLAARLSEDPDRLVALVEAGPDYGPELKNWPPGLLDASSTHKDTHSWNLTHRPGGLAEGLSLPRGKVIGGSSAVNASMWVRCSAADFDEWGALGNPGWSFDELLPYFRKAESDPMGGPMHGTCGLVPVHRVALDELTHVNRAIIEAGAYLGLPWIADLNGAREQSPGIGPSPRNVRNRVRMNSALTYLRDARERPNLTIFAGSLVDRVIAENERATGVCLATGECLLAREVILSAGSYLSPAILLRSGIGPPGHLRALGISMVRELPGVGEHLLEHPCAAGTFLGVITSGSEPSEEAFLPIHLKGRSRQVDREIDFHVYMGESYDDDLGRWTFWMDASLQYSRSQGTVRLASTNPNDAPLIDHNYLSNPADLEALCDATELARELSRTPPLAGIIEPLADRSINWTSRDELRQKVRTHVGTTYHPSSTCRMGPTSDSMAVVDHLGRVHGIDGLRVVDASIFPTGPRGNLHFPVVAVAERIAAGIREEARD